MRSLLTCIFLLSAACGIAQSRPSGISAANKWAIVVGISSYQNPVLSLQYADRDAKEFARFLQSNEGGNMPASHIQLLINENATYPAIYNALDSLLGVCRKDDIVYFYFSGHGDVENSTIYKLGFLLAYNTPRTNYINNAVRIEDLNNFANTLSVKTQAKVILITDACHSGKLAGSDFRANTLIGQQLRTVQNSEIRITSCAPDQLSAEDAGWGGGRGAFSYYLLNGLQGYADKDLDRIVTLQEIRQYLDSSLAADQLLRQKAMKQTPVATGKDDFRLSVVNPLPAHPPQLLISAAAPGPAALPKQPQTYFFNAIDGSEVEKLFDFTLLDKVHPDSLPDQIVQVLEHNIGQLSDLKPDEQKQLFDNLELLRSSIRTNKDALQRFSTKMATVLNARGDDVINAYLQGDAAELTRRSYYSSYADDYNVYPRMFSVAAKLTAPSAYMRKILEIKTQYFGGVAARIKVPTVKDPRRLIDTAMAYQQRALLLEPNAAYIHNELGVLYFLKDQFAAAEKAFIYATRIAPQWAIPWANLAGLYTRDKKNWTKAEEASKEALRLQPDLQIAWINTALLNQKKGRLLTAEEQYLKSIDINTRHYYPFEELGNIYLRTTQYALADSFYFEADLRKKGFHFKPVTQRPLVSVLPLAINPETHCAIDSSLIRPNDVLGNFVLGMYAELREDSGAAEKKYKQVLQLDSLNPLAFHYLGRLLFKQRRWQEAALIFAYAIRNRLDSAQFNRYCDSMIALLPASKNKDCIGAEFRRYQYRPVEDDYFAGRIYDNWNHFAEAELHYRSIIAENPSEMDGYFLLWSMQERFARFRDAEKTIADYAVLKPFDGRNEMNAFYQRATARFPNDPAWLYSAGKFLYDVFSTSGQSFNYDKKTVDADTHLEHYVSLYNQPGNMINIRPHPLELPGIAEPMQYSPGIVFPLTDAIGYLFKADSLFSGDEAVLADIDNKLGDLHVWQGIPNKATVWYEKSVALQPFNAALRQKLIDIYDLAGQFMLARAQLDSLYSRREIDFERQLLLAKYTMHEGEFTFSSSLLDAAKRVHPYRPAQLLELNGRLQWLAGDAQRAIAWYLELIEREPTNTSYLYSLARCYASLGQQEQAWNYLGKAVNKGFGYAWVLKTDDAWKSYRRQQRWDQLMAALRPVEYPVHEHL